MYIQTERDLGQLCERLRDSARLAWDTEFISERTYIPQVGLIQVAGNGTVAAVDPLTVRDLDPLFALLQDPAIEKVVHAGRQELEILAAHGYGPPQPLFDVQIAAALLGHGEQSSYATLVRKLIGPRLRKQETLTNWLQRPLQPAQIEYALADVKYLLPLAEKLRGQLSAQGRTAWAAEEFTKLTEAASGPRVVPGEEYRAVSGWSSLARRTLAVLRELANWREREAQRRNWPRRVVLVDAALLELARRQPKSLTELRSIRTLPRRVAHKNGPEVLAAVRRGQQVPETHLPARPRQPKSHPFQPAVVDLLAALVKIRGMEAHVAPGLLATRGDLETLVQQFHRTGEPDPDLPLLTGWRREVVGEDLLALLSGAISLHLERSTGRVQTQLREGQEEDEMGVSRHPQEISSPPY